LSFALVLKYASKRDLLPIDKVFEERLSPYVIVNWAQIILGNFLHNFHLTGLADMRATF
jgi:hypothetical protein